ncbi:hypothetical protein BCV72DRAFT_328423 [Rhizopus microsporus var. microsporus]|uniref:Uncharacterized protein n=1 Tax=Rhizopus microsporus var. microsporus TaxID=86635 RepID=A0A1X0R3I8_RHIZD|nr:hypothetical protein BCV72DRAFT_328423 [Rhizopus microsporus var. microsporus]
MKQLQNKKKIKFCFFMLCLTILTSRTATWLPIYASIQEGRCDIDKIFGIILTDWIISWKFFIKKYGAKAYKANHQSR